MRLGRRESDQQSGALVQLASDIGGEVAIIASAVAFGPAGALAGAVGGPLLAAAMTKVGRDFQARSFSDLQRQRIWRTFAVGLDEIRARIVGGEQIRQDRFFEAAGEERSTGEEILEGVLVRVRDEYEERKIPYVARLYPAIVFDQSISPEYAYFLLKTADELTYRQIVALAHFGGDNPRAPRVQPDAEFYVRSVRRALPPAPRFLISEQGGSWTPGSGELRPPQQRATSTQWCTSKLEVSVLIEWLGIFIG